MDFMYLTKKQRRAQRNVEREQNRKRKRALKKFRKKYGMRCPKCAHKGYHHRRKSALGFFFEDAVGHMAGLCTKKVREPRADGLVHMVNCPCDLTPQDVRANVRAGTTSALGKALENTLAQMKVADGEN